MSKTILYIGIASLLVLNIFLTQKLKSTETKSEPNNTNETLLKLSDSYYLSYVVNSQFNNSVKLKKELLLTDETGATLTLGQLAANGNKLVIRNTEEGCSACIENELKILKNYAQLLGNDNIVIISTHKNTRKLAVFKQTNGIPFKVFICPDLGIPFEKSSNQTFTFILNNDLTTHNFFIPEVTKSDVSKNYYSAIYDRYYGKSDIYKKIDL